MRDAIRSTTDLDNLRAAIARDWHSPKYVLAAAARVDPVNLSGILRGRLPLRPDIAKHLMAVLDRAKGDRHE